MQEKSHSWCFELVRQNVRRIRTKRGISQHQLAIEADLTRAYVGRLESKGANLTLTTICALADALDVDPRELFLPKDEWTAAERRYSE